MSIMTSQSLTCVKCRLPVQKPYIKALGGVYHNHCFRCEDCNEIVSRRFFQLNNKPYCEKHYHQRMDLICAKCNQAIRGSYVSALGRKFHTECFTCSMCEATFGQGEVYFIHDSRVFCHYHYCNHHARRCEGCKTSILKDFIEAPMNSSMTWHPDCYMMYKAWGIKTVQSIKQIGGISIPPHVSSKEDILKAQQDHIKAVVQRVWHVGSAFEESAATNISLMLHSASEENYGEALRLSDRMIVQVTALFKTFDVLDAKMIQYTGEGMPYEKEPKYLARNIIQFFYIVLQRRGVNNDGAGNSILATTQELLDLVTGLAQRLKILVRMALNAALTLEFEYRHHGTLMSSLLDTLDVAVTSDTGDMSPFLQRCLENDTFDPSGDTCHKCQKALQEECIVIGDYRWRLPCFTCTKCQVSLTDFQSVRWHAKTESPYCLNCGDEKLDLVEIRHCSTLMQYSHVLRVGLWRLIALLKLKVNISLNDPLTKSTAALEIKDSTSLNPTPPAHTLDESDPAASNRSSVIKTSEEEDGDDWPEGRGTFIHNPNVEDFTFTNMVFNIRKDLGRTQMICDVTGLDAFILKRIVAANVVPFLGPYIPAEQIYTLINGGQTKSLWNRLLTSVKPGGKQSKKESTGLTFGVAIEALTEKTGVETFFGYGPRRIVLPKILDDLFRCLLKADLTVVGIFRLNGQIRTIRRWVDEYNTNDMAKIDETNGVLLSALLKKFLRELPDSLLPQKLYTLFLAVAGLDSKAKQIASLRFAVLLLPDVNRTILEVVLLFLRHVSRFAEPSEKHPHGNKMNLSNLALVMAPNILYAKNAAPDPNVIQMECRVVQILLEEFEAIWTVPDEIRHLLEQKDNMDAAGSQSHLLNIPKKVEKRVRKGM